MTTPTGTTTDSVTTRYDSEWSATVSIVTDPDTTAPPVPSAAQFSRSGATLRLRWDGLGRFGESMPSDLDAVEANLSTAAVYTPTTPAQRAAPGFDLSTDTFRLDLAPGATVTITGLGTGTTYYVLLVARDKSGNRSDPSVAVAV